MASVNKHFRIIIICFAFVSCGSVPRYPETQKVAADFIGVVHTAMPAIARENELMDELGIVWVRNDFYWDQIEPRKDEWHFDKFDRHIRDNKKDGKKILAILSFDVDWIYKDDAHKKKHKRNITADNLPHYLNYVEKLVSRYKGQVDAWEIWNEPNMPVFWKGRDEDFFALTKETAAKIKAIDPKAYVIAGAFLYSPFFFIPTKFIKKMSAFGAFENTDAVSFHPYGYNPDMTAGLYDKFKGCLEEIGYKGEVWITEAGYPVAGLYPSRVSEAEYGNYIIKTITMLAAKGVRVLFWYQLKDYYIKGKEPSKFNSEDFFGLAYSNYEKRSGAFSFAKVTEALRASTYYDNWKDKELLDKKTSAFYFIKDNGDHVLIFWEKNSPPQILVTKKQGR